MFAPFLPLSPTLHDPCKQHAHSGILQLWHGRVSEVMHGCGIKQHTLEQSLLLLQSHHRGGLVMLSGSDVVKTGLMGILQSGLNKERSRLDPSHETI